MPMPFGSHAADNAGRRTTDCLLITREVRDVTRERPPRDEGTFSGLRQADAVQTRDVMIDAKIDGDNCWAIRGNRKVHHPYKNRLYPRCPAM